MDNNTISMIFVGIFSGIGIFGGLYILFDVWRGYQTQKRLLATGIKTTDTITRLVYAQAKNKLPSIFYEYTVDGKKYKSRDNISIKSAQEVQKGQSIEISYLPQKPRMSRTELSYDYTDIPRMIITVSIGIGLIIFGIWLITAVMNDPSLIE